MRVAKVGTALIVGALIALAPSREANAQKSRFLVLTDSSGSMLQTPDIVTFPDTCAGTGFNPCATSGGPPPDQECNGCVAAVAAGDAFCENTAWDSICVSSYTGCVGGTCGPLPWTGSIGTRGDGSVEQPGCDVNGDGLANDSRLFQAKESLQIVLASFGEAEFALARFEQVRGGGFCTNSGMCPTAPGGGAPFTCIGNACLRSAPGEDQGRCDIFTWAECDGTFDCATDCSAQRGICVAQDHDQICTGGTSPLDGSPVTCLSSTDSKTITYAGARDYGAGCDPNGGEVLVGFPATSTDDNYGQMLDWIDHIQPTFADDEIRAAGGTPIAASLRDMRTWLLTQLSADTFTPCRPYNLILLSDGGESCETVANAVTAAGALQNLSFTNGLGVPVTGFNVNVYVIAFAVCPPGSPSCQTKLDLDSIALAGGTGTAIAATNQLELQAAISQIISDSLVSELCNGIDDDCDGLIDEDFPGLGNACSQGVGVCLGTGNLVCNATLDGIECNATAGAGTPEVCNGLDDDCNGLVDDGISCTGCVPECAPAAGCDVCDGIDQDCDGTYDEDYVPVACGLSIGQCTPGTTSCVTVPDVSGTVTCTGGTGPFVEICDNLDNDCDTVIDGFSEFCYTGGAELGTGICQGGLHTCEAGAFGPCVGEQTPIPEIACNGLDDNCNGVVDEGQGPEQCDGVDNDCNGIIDDGVAATDPDIGTPCGTPPFIGECQQGQIQCVSGAEACVGEIDPVTEVCDTLDNDCDGTPDDNVPGFGGPCGSAVGLCVEGTLKCLGGLPVCDGGTGPTSEVCDTFDNNCNGFTDEADPSLGNVCDLGGVVVTDDGECRFGNLICDAGGNLVCFGAVGPQAESCNLLDDDCDTLVDEDFPSLGAACDNGMLGICKLTGVVVCKADGTGTTCTAPPGVPGTEICNGLDDDCDCPGDTNGDSIVCGPGDTGVDEGVLPLVGTECSPAIGICAPALWECNAGVLECGMPTTGSPEVCDGVDNDCDGFVDEGTLPGEGVDCVPVGSEMFGNLGECEFGVTDCIAGAISCENYQGPQPEICNGLDDDCDGVGDDMAACPDPQNACFEGDCVVPCLTGEFPCPAGFICQTLPDGPFCVPNPCDGVVCGDGEFCDTDTGTCVSLCDGVDCRVGEQCLNGFCLDCFSLPSLCAAGELCIADGDGVGQCEDNPCEPNPCALDEVCVDGACIGDCSDGCPLGESCIEGSCQSDPCAGVNCPQGQVCDPDDGTCFNPRCDGVSCNPGEVCVDESGECIPDPCEATECPIGTECSVDAKGRPVCAVPEVPPRERVTTGGSSCLSVAGTSTRQRSGSLFLLGLVIALIRRRRRGGDR